MARLAVKPLTRSNLHPNHLTSLGLALGIGAALLYATGIGYLAHLGAGLFVVAVWMDHVDGEYARLTGKTSKFGHYYDHVSAFTGYVALFIGVGFGMQETFGALAVPMGVIAGLAIAVTFTVRVVVEERWGKAMVTQENFFGFEIEDILYIIAPVTWMGQLKWLLIAAATMAPLFMVYVIWQTIRGRNATSF